MYESHIRIRSTQVDQFGHLNNAAFLEIFEWARWEWAESGNFSFKTAMKQRGLGPVVVHADVSFRREVRFHETVRIETTLERCDSRKGVMHQRMLCENGDLASEGRFSFVTLDLAQRRVVPLPDEIRALVEGIAEE